MTRKYILFISALFVAANAFGQLKGAVPQAKTPAHMNEQRKIPSNSPAAVAKNNADKLNTSLKLSEKQHKDLYLALLDYETNVDKTTKSKLSKSDQFKKMNELNIKRQEKLKLILNKEQYHAYIMSFP